jgi:hypothetical protein
LSAATGLVVVLLCFGVLLEVAQEASVAATTFTVAFCTIDLGTDEEVLAFESRLWCVGQPGHRGEHAVLGIFGVGPVFGDQCCGIGECFGENWTNAEDPQNGVLPTMARLPDTPQSRLKGQNLFISTKINCAKCHGEGGRGNGGFLSDFQKNPETQQNYDTPVKHKVFDS